VGAQTALEWALSPTEVSIKIYGKPLRHCHLYLLVRAFQQR